SAFERSHDLRVGVLDFIEVPENLAVDAHGQWRHLAREEAAQFAMTALEEYGQVLSRVHRGGADRSLRGRALFVCHGFTRGEVKVPSTYIWAKNAKCGKEISGDDG